MPSPTEHLNAAMRQYPNTGDRISEFLGERGKSLPKWPAWCLMPMAGYYTIVCDENDIDPLPPHLVADVSRLSAIATWRYTQGIYRLAPEFYTAMLDCPISGIIPTEVLYRLPEWSVYIETPGYQFANSAQHGFWAHLEHDINTERPELRLLLNTDGSLIPIPIHIGPWTVTEAIDRATDETLKQMKVAGLTPPESTDDAVQALADTINPLIAMLLYLCTDEPEIDDERVPDSFPHRPKPKKTKKGWRLFPAKKTRVWNVGSITAKKLRVTAATDDPKRSVTAHVRRAHWHGFWKGPRGDNQKFFYKWLPPIVVDPNDSE